MKIARVSVPFLLLFVGSAWGFIFNMAARAAVGVSNPADVPVDALSISQLTGGGTALQSRHTSTTDWKGIGQAFTWNSYADLDGVGLFIDDAVFSNDQQHWLILQKLDGPGGPVTSTVFQVKFTIPSATIGADRWIYFDIENQKMVEGQDYGITLVAAEDAVSTQRIYWACSADSSAYAEGDANQIDIPTRGLPPSSSHNFVASANRDTVFYLTASTVSNPESLPLERIAVSQLSTGGDSLQVRNTSASDWRGVAQSILWTTDSALDGIGVYLSSAQTAWSSDQQYVLVVQALDGYRGEGTTTVAQVEFTLRKENVGPDRWLYINIDNLYLTGGEWYGFMLAPAQSAVGSNRLFIETTASSVDTLYGDGSANQFHLDVRGLPPSGAYGSAGEDLVFYMTVPEFPSAWLPAGNEKEDVVDSSTGKTVHYLTAGDSIDTHFHYHGGTWGWIYGKQYLFFDSSRDRPAGAGATIEGERQLMAVNPLSGDLYYLTTIPRDGGSFSHINTRAYYSTYNDVAKTIFFFNKTTRSKLYAYNCLTGEQKLILDLTSPGVSTTEMDDFVDAQSVRIAYSYTISTASGVVYRTAVSDFDRDLNLQNTEIIREALPGEALDHVEISPVNKNMILYLRKYDTPQVLELRVRDMTNQTEQVITLDGGLKLDHHVWGASGEYIYWDNNRYTNNLYAYELATDNIVRFGGTSSNAFYVGHNKLSSDERLWVFDDMELGKSGTTALFTGTDEYGVSVENWNGSIWIYDRQTATTELYANIVWAHPHPRHPHAVFSTDDSMISFVTGAAVTNENTRIAVMKLSE